MNRTTIASMLSLAMLAGCSGPLQQVEIDEPANAKVVILEGVGVPRVETRTPFSGRFEALSLRSWAAYDLTFELDDKAASRFGSNQPLKIYGKLVVGSPTEASRHVPLVLRMPADKLVELVRGARSEIEVFVEDRQENPPKELATLTLRMAPF